MANERIVNVEVSTQNMDRLIASKVELAMIESLSEDREVFVEKIVRAALGTRCDVSGHNHGYNREEKPTTFECQVNAMVRETAQQTFKVWLDDNGALIREAIELRLRKAPKKFVNDIAKAMVDGLAGKLVVEAKLEIDRDRY